MERPRILRLLASVALGLVVILAGFASGLVVGVVSEEPDLLLAHLGDAGEVVHFEEASSSALAPVAAPPPALPPRDPAVAPVADRPSGTQRDSGVAAPNAAASADALRRGAAEPASAARPKPPSAAAKRPAPRPAQRAPAEQAGVPYAVQVGAFENSQAAEALAGTLRRKGYPVQIAPSVGERTQRWRVRVGPLDSREDADADALRLEREERLPTWVLQVQ